MIWQMLELVTFFDAKFIHEEPLAHEFYDARIKPNAVVKFMGRINVSPQMRPERCGTVIDAHRDDATLAQERLIDLLERWPGQDKKERAASI